MNNITDINTNNIISTIIKLVDVFAGRQDGRLDGQLGWRAHWRARWLAFYRESIEVSILRRVV